MKKGRGIEEKVSENQSRLLRGKARCLVRNEMKYRFAYVSEFVDDDEMLKILKKRNLSSPSNDHSSRGKSTISTE